LKQSSNAGLVVEATTLPFWPWCNSQFHHSPLTTLQTQVSFVCIGHRIRPLSAFWLADRVLCQWASHPQQCRCWTQATPSSCHCLNTALSEQHFPPLEGAQSPMGSPGHLASDLQNAENALGKFQSPTGSTGHSDLGTAHGMIEAYGHGHIFLGLLEPGKDILASARAVPGPRWPHCVGPALSSSASASSAL